MRTFNVKLKFPSKPTEVLIMGTALQDDHLQTNEKCAQALKDGESNMKVWARAAAYTVLHGLYRGGHRTLEELGAVEIVGVDEIS